MDFKHDTKTEVVQKTVDTPVLTISLTKHEAGVIRDILGPLPGRKDGVDLWSMYNECGKFTGDAR